MAANPVAALRDVSLRIAPGEYIGVVGPSGCGKSTLLHVLGIVDVPTSGQVLFDDRDVSSLSDADRSRVRLREIGFVFQSFFLLPMLTAWENVELPMAEAGVARAERRERTRELLEYVGLAARAAHRPSELSGGEMQRVAIARALANRPRILLADEPTGELDQATGEQIISLIDRLNADGMAVVVVTHDLAIAARAQRLLAHAGWPHPGGDRADDSRARASIAAFAADPQRGARRRFRFGRRGHGGAAGDRSCHPRPGARAGPGRRRRRHHRRLERTDRTARNSFLRTCSPAVRWDSGSRSHRRTRGGIST